MRSGIGAKDELMANDIDCLVDLPGVGKNLMDHPVCLGCALVGMTSSKDEQQLTTEKLILIFYEVNDSKLTHDRLVYEPGSLATTYDLWKSEKTGFLSTFPFGIFSWARLDDRLKDSKQWQDAQRQAPEGRDAMHLTKNQPHVEYWNTELYAGLPSATDFPVGEKGSFALAVILMNERSRGTVTLDKNDRLGAPLADHNYLANPLDELMLAEGCRFGNEIIMTSAATKAAVKGSWPASATHHQNVTREDWAPFVRDSVGTCYHPSGTCKMANSSSNDPSTQSTILCFKVLADR